jgi:hypothetical protein
VKRRGPKNLTASVQARLLNLARHRGEDFQLVLTRYGIERLLYRLSRSPYRDEFILKGAMLFQVWADEPHRPTRDLDLLGRGPTDVQRLTEVFRAICTTPVVDDGIHILVDTILITALREFLMPPVHAARTGRRLDVSWYPGGPWAG